MQRADVQQIGGTQAVHLAVQIVVIRFACLFAPDGFFASFAVALGHFVFRRDLFGVLAVAALIDHPRFFAVLAPHPRCDHIFVFSAVAQHKLHPVCLGAGLVDGRNLIVSELIGRAFDRQRPFAVIRAERVHFVGLVAGVDETERDHAFFAAFGRVFRIHQVFQLRPRIKLPVRDVLRRDVIAERADRVVQAVFLHIDACRQQLRPIGHRELRNVRLPFQHEIGVRFQLRIFPRLAEP